MDDLQGVAFPEPWLSLAVDWPAAVLWPSTLMRWGPSRETAFRAARLHAYSLARLAGWREQAPRFARGPIDFAALFLPARSRYWHAEGARAALQPTMDALGDILHRPAIDWNVTSWNVDFEPRLGIVVVGVRPGEATA